MGHGQGEGCCHSGVDSVPASTEDVDADLSRLPLYAGDNSVRARNRTFDVELLQRDREVRNREFEGGRGWLGDGGTIRVRRVR